MHLSKSALLSLVYFASPSFGLFNLGVPGISWTYDYVVIGGGTSGLAIAARLAEDPGVTVAVIEAGGHYEVEEGIMSIIPGFAAAANTGTDPSDDSMLIDWNFDAQPLTAADDRVLRYARGKCLGGTSARNLMVYHRGTKNAYDQWADITGDSSWEWDSVLPYFKKSATLTAPNTSKRNANASVIYNADAFDNSQDGPLQVSWPNYGSPFSSWVEVGLEGIGILPGQDLNSGSLNGSAWAATTIDPAAETRSSSKTSFLDLCLLKLNFKAYAHTLAKKINFSGTKAKSVEVETLGISYTLTASKEIILSAGAFQSPQLLMVSGIGPKSTLEPLGINIVKDLPGVGQNLWDHALFGVVNKVNVITASRLVNDETAALEALAQYALKSGPLTAPGFGVLGFERFPDAIRNHFSNTTRQSLDDIFPPDWPEVEYLGLDGILDGWHNADDQDLGDGFQYGTIAAALTAPLSRGNISINSTSITDTPLINLGYLTHKADQEVAIAALKRARAAFNATGIIIGDEYRPGPDVQSDEQILAFIRSTIVPVWHAAGTCRMGGESDPEAVVDATGKVYGVSGLRVVDASIFPTLPPGHPQSTCYMVAEKIADDIKNGN
ncbi:GMC family oxidoreductase [Aspergillus stella-maris]|uniref:GMC family oxidoreductase n=1 Tax=Aspergillus stella-maris TaxID=1810926 RepID=UPI003CCD95B6